MKINLPVRIKKPVLALGSQTKNTICFASGKNASISSVHSDLNNPSDLAIFEKDVKYFLKKKPRIIAADLHPDYQSSKYIPVDFIIQHHHAHIASCMAENGLKDTKVRGVAFDGTGLGDDGRIWGAEFLACDYKCYKRLAHLKEIPLVGGERAILEPWRLVEAWFNFTAKTKRAKLLKKIYSSGINSPLASSMGRLFDAAGSIILKKSNANFEAELAIKLEECASKFRDKGVSYKFNLKKNKGIYIIDPVRIIKGIALDTESGKSQESMAFNFHLTVAQMISRVCSALREDAGIKSVVLSGGVFQNKLLLSLSLDLLYKRGFNVITHKKLSCNDSCVSLGQAVIASMRGK
jgi:hydrogenase maturation protein HypF